MNEVHINSIIIKAPMRKEAKKILREEMEHHYVHKFLQGNSKKALDHFFANTILMTNIPIFPMIDKSCIIMNDTSSDFFIYMKYGVIKIVRYRNWIFCTYDVRNTFSTIFRVNNVGKKEYYFNSKGNTLYDENFVLDIVNTIIQDDQDGKIYTRYTKGDHMQKAVLNQSISEKKTLFHFIKKWIKGNNPVVNFDSKPMVVNSKIFILRSYHLYFLRNKSQPIVRVSQNKAVLQTIPNRRANLYHKLGPSKMLDIHVYRGKSLVVANIPYRNTNISFCYLLQTRNIKTLTEKIMSRLS